MCWRKQDEGLTSWGLYANLQVNLYLAVGKLGIDGLVHQVLVDDLHEQNHAKSYFLGISTHVQCASVPGNDSSEFQHVGSMLAWATYLTGTVSGK